MSTGISSARSQPQAKDRDAALAELAADVAELEILPHDRRAESEWIAVAAAQRARALGAVDLELRAQLVQADAFTRKGRTAAGARIVREVNRWATEHQHRYLLARSHRHLAALVRSIGDYPTSLEHAVKAVELTDDDMPPRIRIDHLTLLAIALARIGDFDSAEARFAQAERETEALGDLELTVMLLNNVAYMNHHAGHPDRALAAARRMDALAHEIGMPTVFTYIDTLGRALLGAGLAEEAVAVIQQSVDEQNNLSEPDALADLLLTLAEAQRALGNIAQAQATLDRCQDVCVARHLAEIKVRVHQQRAELYAAQDRYREAYEEHKRFSTASAELYSSERDGRAKIVQAVFETAEARRDSERFRRLSLHDPLTNLYNRRYVDENLPGLLESAVKSGAPLSVALVDLDRFKRINDTWSHEAGDAVLAAVAGLLEQSMPRGAVAARLGGEEFLLVLPGSDEAAMVALCERLRGALSAFDWRPIAADLAVTASFGVASVNADTQTQLDLLRRADAHLYLAKHTGRDRIVAHALDMP